jgi:exopolysaccharide biosynthesis polyprenyl glycosylphosphotransferase
VGALFTVLLLLNASFGSRSLLLIFAVALLLVLVALRLCLIWWYFHRSDARNENLASLLIIGTGERAQRLSAQLRRGSEWGVEIVGYLDCEGGGGGASSVDMPILGHVGQIESVLRQNVVDEVIIAVPRTMIRDAQVIADACEAEGVKLSLMADVFDLQVARTTLHKLNGIPLLSFEPVAQEEICLFVKRTFDLVATLAAVPLILPVMVAVALAIKMDSHGPVLFAQERVGLRKRRFRMYKFRSMHSDAEARLKEFEHLNEAEGPIFKIANDPRLTRVGGFLRRTSLDELPQLVNVLRGHMSLVGPRPMSLRDVALFDQSIQRKRFSVRPGLTCLWQISGRSNLPFSKWLELDLMYIENWSLWLDIKILVMTVPKVMFRNGAV